MKKIGMTLMAMAMLSGSGAAMAHGNSFGAGFVTGALLGSLAGNTYTTPALVKTGYPVYYGAPPAYYYAPAPDDWRYHHWRRWHHFRHWRPYYYDHDDWRWRRHEWREHEWREHEWREHHWRDWD